MRQTRFKKKVNLRKPGSVAALKNVTKTFVNIKAFYGTCSMMITLSFILTYWNTVVAAQIKILKNVIGYSFICL